MKHSSVCCEVVFTTHELVSTNGKLSASFSYSQLLCKESDIERTQRNKSSDNNLLSTIGFLGLLNIQET